MTIFEYQEEESDRIKITWSEETGYALVVTYGERQIDSYQHECFAFVSRHIGGVRRYYDFTNKHELDVALNDLDNSEMFGERDKYHAYYSS